MRRKIYISEAHIVSFRRSARTDRNGWRMKPDRKRFLTIIRASMRRSSGAYNGVYSRVLRKSRKTERERRRAEDAEARIRELEKMLKNI